MRSTILLCILITFNQKQSFSQWIFEEKFNSIIPNMIYGQPAGILDDLNWYSYDGDTLIDGSGESRPNAWFRTLAFTLVDSIAATGDTNHVMASNSMFITPGKAKNWLITPAIYIESGQGWLQWRSAPFSTPYKLDGFKVLASTTTNDTSSFTIKLFETAEYTGPGNMGADFNLYNFNPTTSFIHGWDGDIIQPEEVQYYGDSSQWRGVLTQNSYACLPFSNQSIYLAFVHDSFDDNMISIDDIKIWGACVGVSDEKNDLDLTILPNPFIDQLSINSSSEINKIKIFDVSGRLQFSIDPKTNSVSLDLSFLSSAPYFVEISSNEDHRTYKIIKTE
jgi:Secretion system C-terminal sorting domain/Cleaved Adhesin Domain